MWYSEKVFHSNVALFAIIVVLFIEKSVVVVAKELLDITTESKHYELEYVKNFDQFLQISHQFSKNVARPFLNDIFSQSNNISVECRTVLERAVSNPELEWAALMIDSSGRLLRSGFLSGTITDYGDFDQCMSIRELPDNEFVSISSRYCLINARPPIPPPGIALNYSGTTYENSWPSKRFADPNYRFFFRVVSGLCFPTVCQPEEVQQIVQKAFENFNLEITVENCQQYNQRTIKLDFAQILSITIIGLCLSSVIIGTLLELYCCSNEKLLGSKFEEILRCFSLIRNCQTLFNIDDHSQTLTKGQQGPAQQEITPIHGLRVLLIMWVILCHTTNFAPLGLYDQPMIAARFSNDFNQNAKAFLTQFVISGSLSVQSFFVISGLISLHTSLKNRLNFARQVPYWKYILLRWIRFAPPLLGMFCYQFIWPLLGSGPIMHWDFLKYGHQPCYQSWYANFLFISNWYQLVDQCGSHTWFLSADFQINLFAYFIILAYVTKYRLGLHLNRIAFVVASIGPSLIHLYYSVPLVHIVETDMKKLNQAFSMIEFNTYNHFAAYFAGLLVAGYLNRPSEGSSNDDDKTKSKNKPNPSSPISPLSGTLFWSVSLLSVAIVPFSTYPFINMDQIPATFWPIVYTGIKRLFWIVSFSWIVYATSSCSRHCLLARILSAKILRPLSRLTFCIYLVQSLVVWFYAYNARELHFISHYNTLFRVGGVTLYSLIFAFILYALFEAPSINLCKMALKPKYSPTAAATPDSDLNNNRLLPEDNEKSKEQEMKDRRLSQSNIEQTNETNLH